MSIQFDWDDEAIARLETIQTHEETIRAACEEIRSEIGSLINHMIPFDHHGHIQYGTVEAVSGYGWRYGIWIVNNRTGTRREISTYDVFVALRRLELEAAAEDAS